MQQQFSNNFYSLLMESVRTEGFTAFGALDLDLAQEAFDPHSKRFEEWMKGGLFGEMEYLQRGADRRKNPRLLFPEAQSILCVATPYPAASTTTPKYARYLTGRDYHKEICEKLELVMKRVQATWQTPLQWKVCVDTSAILERSWAALAGLGWIGKNSMLIHPQHGSYLFLGEVLISEKTGQGPAPIPNYCGNCTRCLDACPTGAFLEPGKLSAPRCISYWTLEKRGSLDSLLQPGDREKMGTWIAGCDICQEVCPFNTKRMKKAEVREKDPGLITDWTTLIAETEDQYKKRIAQSALKRVKPEQFSRNLAIALSNEESKITVPLLPLIRERTERETSEVAKKEWVLCLEKVEALKNLAETNAIQSNIGLVGGREADRNLALLSG